MNIDFDLEDLKGVQKAQTNFARQECVIEFDEEQVSLDEIISQVKATGYAAVPVAPTGS